MPILYPAGSIRCAAESEEEFMAQLDGLGYPAPWRLDKDEPGRVLAENGAGLLLADRGNVSVEQATARVVMAVRTVNILAGYGRVFPDDWHA